MIGGYTLKDSGFAWLGAVPEHWGIHRLKNHLKRSEPRNPGNQQVLSLYRELGVIPKDSRDDNHNVTSEDTSNYKYVSSGDFVINKMKAWQGSVAVSDYEGIVSPAYYVYKFKDDSFNRRYFHYLLRSCYKDEFMRLSGGIRIGQWDLASSDLDNVPVILPYMEEQDAIADFLDKEVDQIDSLISEAKASIEEYKLWKSSIIYEAVTKGLDPNVEMKESGVEWIGEIPLEWDVCCIKRLTRKIGSGKTPTGGAEGYVDSGVIFLRSQNIYNEGLKLEDVSHISKEVDEEMKNTRVQFEDVLLNITGGSIGRCCIYDLIDTVANVNQHVCILRTDKQKMLPQYLRYFWNSASGPAVIEHFQTGGNRQGLNFEQIGNVKVPFCSIEIQREIVEYLDKQCAMIGSLISEKESLISDLESYKKSLIFEVVTGKRKVV